ncbi:MAG: ABC transporter ATP-binding protein [Afipia sp.]
MDRNTMQPLANVTSFKPATTTGAGAIQVSNVSQVFKTTTQDVVALDNVSLEVTPGRFVVLVGPSGCGKSTLLMMMAGLREQTSGTVLINGTPITKPDPDRVGVVFQEASLFPWLTAEENVEFPLTLRGTPKAERRAKAQDALKLVGLDGFGKRHPHELSGGMKQRVSIARGLVQNPPVLLMDEPFAALDEQTRMTMGDELLRIWAATGKTVVFVTHSLTEAVYLADEVLVMSARPGRIVDRLQVPLPRPRTYDMLSGETFGTLRDRIWRHIRKSA